MALIEITRPTFNKKRRKKKEEPDHRDYLGEVLNAGDTVIYTTSKAGLRKGYIYKMTDKMIRIMPYGSTSKWSGKLIYSSDCIKMEDKE